MKTFQIQSIRLSSNLAFSVLKSRKVFFCNSLAAQCTTASRQWALPIRGQTAELGLSLGPASALAGPAKVCPCFCTTCKRLPLQDSGSCPCLPCKSLASAHARPAQVCLCFCRICKSLPLHSGPAKFWALTLLFCRPCWNLMKWTL